MVKVGIIGCGRIAQRRHVPEYSRNPNAEIIGYYDEFPSRAEALAREYGGKVYHSLDEFFDDGQIDAVSVCVANNAHARISIRAMEAGKHVLCEKPIATTVEDARDMVNTAQKTGRFLMIGQNQRYNTGHIRAKELVRDGLIGTPLTFKTTFAHSGPERWIMDEDTQELTKDIWFFDKKIASMGAMADLGIHKIDLIQYILDDDITEVTAKVMTLDKKDSNGEPIELEDNAICIFKTKKGTFGTMTASWTNYGEEDNSTIIFGTKGIMRLYDDRVHTIKISTDRGDKIYYDLDRMMTNQEQLESGVIRAFVKALESHDWSDMAGEREINALRAVMASFQSSREDRTILL